MSLRKLAGLLAAFGLTVGLIGGGVGAVFQDQVTATENIHVGSFGCIISATTAGDISVDQKSVVYNAADITSSAAGSAPFTFTVKSTGSIPVTLKVTQTTPPPPFTSILAAPADVNLTQNGTHDYAAGLQWTELGHDNLGTGIGIVYTINCVEVPTVRHWSAGIAGHVGTHNVDPSTNATNQSNGWAYVTVDDSTITFQGARFTNALGGSCIEYRFNDNVPEQRLTSGAPPVFRNNPNYPLITDGYWPHVCIATDLNPIQTITIPAGVTTFEVRSAFGAEGDERFDWTRFNLVP